MLNDKFIQTGKLLEYLKQKTNNLLQSNKIYDISSYGWLTADDIDFEYLGIAMWSTSSNGIDWGALLNNGFGETALTTNQQRLMLAGADFEGLMRASMMSIGLCLLYETNATILPQSYDNHADNCEFWLHYNNSLVNLSMASDRIREYFIVVIFGQSLKKYNNNKTGKKLYYNLPFKEAGETHKSYGKSPISLLDMAGNIHKYKKIRNKMMHELSTNLGKAQKEFIEDYLEGYTNKTGYDMNFDFEIDIGRTNESIKQIKKEYRKELSECSLTIIKWYKLLIEFSNRIFEANFVCPDSRKLYEKHINLSEEIKNKTDE